MENCNNIYIGLVTQNNDPEMRGRVKVYIPQVCPTITKLNENVDKFFNFVGNNTSPDITNVLEEINDVLPWAEYAGPIAGGNASGRYNATTNNSTTSDSNAWADGVVVEGFRPANNYTGHQAVPDAFNATNKHNNLFINPYSYQYTPSNYSNLARGMFSIPNVGSHVYVFFINGDKNFPVYFASAYGEEDIKRVYTLAQDVKINTSLDYPATYENIKKDKIDSDVKTFRSKTVLNSNKNTIEMIDTDLKEIMKFTHYSGSFKEFNNYATIELATKNDQKMVMGDQFLTVGKNKSEYVGNHNETIIGGDRYLTIGETKKATVSEILKIHKQIHKFKTLFDTQRLPPKGVFKVCPVCGGKPYLPYDPTYLKEGESIMTMWQEAPKYLGSCWKLLASQEGVETEGSGEEEQKIGFGLACHTYLSNEFSEPLCPAVPHPFQGMIGYYKGMKCPCCNGTVVSIGGIGFSPSTEEGLFPLETKKQQGGQLDQTILELTPELVKLEKELGLGGDEIVNVSMSKIETIGLVMNDMESIRIDPIGKLKIDGCWVSPQGTFENFKPSPHVEYVDVADIPGGDYILTVMNKYKLLVGSKGINMQTTGPIDIYGTITNIAADQLNISSKNEIVVDGGERLSLRARKITMLPFEHNAVAVEGQLHVTRNVIVEGGMMLEGELALLHVTAPLEWQETEVGAYVITSSCEPIPCNIGGVGQTTIRLPPHTHYFKNIPLTLLPHVEAVRSDMITKGINSRSRIAAASVRKIPSNCEGGAFEEFSGDFHAVAYEAAKVNTHHKDILPIHVVLSTSPTCTPINETTYTVNAIYRWRFEGHTGIVYVTGTISEGELIEGPTAT